MAQGRLEFEVAFQSSDITNAWSCDWYLTPTAKYAAWKILLHEWMRRVKYINQSFSLFQSFGVFSSFFPLSALTLRGWLTKSVIFLPKREMHPQNYHIWCKLNLDPCTYFLQDCFRLRVVIQVHLPNEDELHMGFLAVSETARRPTEDDFYMRKDPLVHVHLYLSSYM